MKLSEDAFQYVDPDDTLHEYATVLDPDLLDFSCLIESTQRLVLSLPLIILCEF